MLGMRVTWTREQVGESDDDWKVNTATPLATPEPNRSQVTVLSIDTQFCMRVDCEFVGPVPCIDPIQVDLER